MISIRTQINGEAHELDVSPAASALEVVRERLGLRGAKLVCGTGACGACTVLLDSVPVACCLLPASALEGHELRTIEGLAPDGELHPVQRAFVVCDALQCGYCTPGLVVGATAFFDRWRREHGSAVPSREQVAAALAGHLCRCGAYPGIYAAVQEACAGRHDQPADPAGPQPEPAGPRVEAAAKVTGRARYTTDVRLDGQLEGVIVRSTLPSAEIGPLDTAACLAVSGVAAVVELLGADRRVRYAGQEILAVAATDRRTALAAAAVVEVPYRPLPAVVSTDAASAPDAPLVHDGRRRRQVPNSAESQLPTPGRWHGNLHGPSRLLARRGRRARRLIEAARRAGDPGLVEAVWRTAAQSHTPFEPHACVADWREGGLTVHLSTQAVSEMARVIARRWRLAPERVRVVAEHVGGGFGAKLGLTEEAVAAIELSRAASAPVQVVLDRREELAVGGYRSATTMRLAALTDAAGQLTAVSAEAVGDAGVAVGSGVAGLLRFIYPGSPGRKAAKDLADANVVTNNPPARPFRGPSGPIACWAMEQTVDEIAHRRDEDPLALRRRWDPHPGRQRLYDWAEKLDAWRDRGPVAAGGGRVRQGVGLAAANWLYTIQPRTRVRVTATPAGLRASVAVQDIGTGIRTVVARTVAEVFGVDPRVVAVELGDSRLPLGPVSAASSTTASVVPAAIDAAEQVRDRLVRLATGRLGLEDARAGRGEVAHAGGTVPWLEALAPGEEVSAVGARRRDRRRYVLPPMLTGGWAYGHGFTGAVVVATVEVDTRFGAIRVPRVWEGLAAGRVAAPELARAQCQGGIVQGIGFALHEERQLDPVAGLVLSAALDHYRIPGLAETPEIEVHFLDEREAGFDHVRAGAVGLAELSTLAVAAAIGNAVFHATGWRPHDLPIRPDRVLAGLDDGIGAEAGP